MLTIFTAGSVLITMIATQNLAVEVEHLPVMERGLMIVDREPAEVAKPRKVVAVPAIGVPTRTKLVRMKAT